MHILIILIIKIILIILYTYVNQNNYKNDKLMQNFITSIVNDKYCENDFNKEFRCTHNDNENIMIIMYSQR